MKSILGEEPSADTEVGILRSRMVLGRAVDQQQLTLQVTPKRLPVVGDFLVRHGMERPGFAEASVWAGEAINVAKFQVSPMFIDEPFELTVLSENRYRLSLEDRELGEGKASTDESFLDGSVQLRVAELQAGEGATFTLQKSSRLAVINDLRSRFGVSQQGKDSGLLDLSLSDTDPQRAARVLDAISEVYLTQNVQRQAAEAEKVSSSLRIRRPRCVNSFARRKISSTLIAPSATAWTCRWKPNRCSSASWTSRSS